MSPFFIRWKILWTSHRIKNLWADAHAAIRHSTALRYCGGHKVCKPQGIENGRVCEGLSTLFYRNNRQYHKEIFLDRYRRIEL